MATQQQLQQLHQIQQYEEEKRVRATEFKMLLRDRLDEAERRSKESAIVRHAVKPEKSVRRQLDQSPSEAKQIVLNADPILKQARADTVLNRFRRAREKFLRYSLRLPLEEVNDMLLKAAEKDFGREVADEHFRTKRLQLITTEERQAMQPLAAQHLTTEMLYDYFVWSNDVERNLIDKTRYTEMEWPAELGRGPAYHELETKEEEKEEEQEAELEQRRRKFYVLFYILRDMKKKCSVLSNVKMARDWIDSKQDALLDRESRYIICTDTALRQYQKTVDERINQANVLRVMDDLVANYPLLRQLREFSNDI